MKEFLNMGGYGFYVWWSYGVAMIIMLAQFIVSGNCLKKAKANIRRRLRREGKI